MVPPSAPKLPEFGSPDAPLRPDLHVPLPQHVRPNSLPRQPQVKGVVGRDLLSPEDLDLGVHEDLRPFLVGAGSQYGVPSQALAETIEKETNGSWDFDAVNGNHVGAMQFASPTWLGEAKRKGSYLNGLARQRGYLNDKGQVRPQSRQELLDLRKDPKTSIYAGADYHRFNVDHLERLLPNATSIQKARAGYAAHHNGLSGAEDQLQHRRDVSKHTLFRNFPRQAVHDAMRRHEGNVNAAFDELETASINSFDPTLFTHEGQARARIAKAKSEAEARQRTIARQRRQHRRND